MKLRNIVITYIALAFYTTAPLLSVAISSAVAHYCGCELNEGTSNPCQLWGVEIGDALYNLFVIGWLSLVTIPTGFLSMIGFTVFLVINKMEGREKASNQERNLALWSIIISALGLVIGMLASIPGIVLGILALKKIQNSETPEGENLAKAGILVGFLGIIIQLAFLR
jgi:hypothetical protein